MPSIGIAESFGVFIFFHLQKLHIEFHNDSSSVHQQQISLSLFLSSLLSHALICFTNLGHSDYCKIESHNSFSLHFLSPPRIQPELEYEKTIASQVPWRLTIIHVGEGEEQSQHVLQTILFSSSPLSMFLIFFLVSTWGAIWKLGLPQNSSRVTIASGPCFLLLRWSVLLREVILHSERILLGPWINFWRVEQIPVDTIGISGFDIKHRNYAFLR